jgi:hypothetical protein
MGAKNVYERFVWFDNQVRAKRYPQPVSGGEFVPNDIPVLIGKVATNLVRK